MWKGLINAYRSHLPISENTPVVSLQEGNTPLIRAKHIEKYVPGLEVYLKYEGLNPTGSFKDRGMTMAVSKAKESGSQAVICASTGNTSASAAAYAARAGLSCFVVIPSGKIAMGKLAQAIAYGAHILPIEGNFDEALELVKAIEKKQPVTLVNSLNPYRIEGQKTAAFEICDQLGDAPNFLCIPVGNAGNITAYWKGFQEYVSSGNSKVLPQIFGFQAAGAAPIVMGSPVKNPETIATAIRIGNPANWEKAELALEQSRGVIDKQTDEQILRAHSLLSREEGIFAEPASAISLAGLLHAYKNEHIRKGRVVCILTGNGLKDPDVVINSTKPLEPIHNAEKNLEKMILNVLKKQDNGHV